MQTELSYSVKPRGKSPQLIVTDADQQQSHYVMAEGKSLLAGSGEACAIRLPAEDANLLHCMFRLTDGALWVRDWNTEGKTLFNGTRLNEAARLTEHDELLIGSYRFSASLPADAQLSSENYAEAPVDQSITSSSELEIVEIEEPAFAQISDVPDDSSKQSSGELIEQTEEFSFDDFCFEEDDSLLQALNENIMTIMHPDPDESIKRGELELLRNEVLQLQIELAEKDNQLLQLCEATQFSGQSGADVVTTSQTEKLVVRLEELLAELEGADEKVAALENQLQAAEYANQAELEERRQLESWVNQIEQRVLNREAELAAESEKLQESVREERRQRTHVESQLKNALKLSNGVSGDHAAREMIVELRKQNVELERRLSESLREVESQKENSRPVDAEVDPVVMREMERRARALESELANERAETARTQEQLARFQNELEKRLNEVKQTAENESRVNAMKQHLRELHQEEKLEQQERFERSLGGRITKLWQKLDGR